MIGIKLADGSFYPVLEEGVPGSKKIMLSTARNHQDVVHIDLFRGAEGTSLDAAEHIAGIVLEGLCENPGEESEIELSLSMDDRFNLSATARDACSGEYQSLHINVGTTGSGNFEIPDAEYSENSESPVTRAAITPNPVAVAAFVIFGFFIIAVLLYFFFQYFKGTAPPPLQAVILPAASASLWRKKTDAW